MFILQHHHIIPAATPSPILSTAPRRKGEVQANSRFRPTLKTIMVTTL
jgi:hypothetical protein